MEAQTLLHHLLPQRTTTLALAINRRIMSEPPPPPPPPPSPSPSPPPSSDSSNTDWAYTKPVVVVDVVWNLAFVFVALFILLFSTLNERPSTPLRVWICGYGLQCCLHVGFVYFDCQWREADHASGIEEGLVHRSSESGGTSVAKSLDSVNTVVSFFWWVVGFYWIVVGGQPLLQDAPRLYWLAVVFLAFDVFFAIFCVVLACMIGIALCCCLPCIIVMLYSVVAREGASEDDIKLLPKYKFCQITETMLADMRWKQDVTAMEMESAGDSTSEISLPAEDSVCCICLSKYVHGVELNSLPCNHYFHCACIAKWLRINAKCPLCKYNLLGDEVV